MLYWPGKQILICIFPGTFFIVQYFVTGAKLQALDGAGRSPLHYASKHGAVDVVHWLAETKVHLNVQDGKRKSIG